MRAFIVRKSLLVPVSLLGAVCCVFVLMYLTPGDPARMALGEFATEEAVAELRRQWGLDRPWYEQLGKYVLGVLKGDLGYSLRTGRRVSEEILRTLPPTAFLAFAALGVSSLLGVPLGVLAAVKRGGALDKVCMSLAVVGISMPVFWFGILLVLLFGLKLGLLPTFGYGSVKHVVLPAVTLGLVSAAPVARMARSSLLEVLGEDYVRTARAKGLPERVVVFRHALKNALIPVVTVVGLQFGALLGGAVVVETVFSWPGLGRLVVTSILSRDSRLLQGAVLFIAGTYIMGNFVVDLLYAWLDPRIRLG